MKSPFRHPPTKALTKRACKITTQGRLTCIIAQPPVDCKENRNMTNTQRIAAYIDSSPNKEKLKAALPLLLDLFFQKNEECC